MAQWLTNPTRNHEVVGSVAGLAPPPPPPLPPPPPPPAMRRAYRCSQAKDQACTTAVIKATAVTTPDP